MGHAPPITHCQHMQARSPPSLSAQPYVLNLFPYTLSSVPSSHVPCSPSPPRRTFTSCCNQGSHITTCIASISHCRSAAGEQRHQRAPSSSSLLLSFIPFLFRRCCSTIRDRTNPFAFLFLFSFGFLRPCPVRCAFCSADVKSKTGQHRQLQLAAS